MKHELKATRLDILRFIRTREIVDTMDLMNEFGYTYRGARTRLHRLERGKLVEKLGIRAGAYCLTSEAIRRLEYYDQKQ